MTSPFTFTRTCSIMSARSAAADDSITATVATKSCFFIVFNILPSFTILPYRYAFAQIPEQSGNAAEHSAFGARILLLGPQDLLPREAARDLARGGSGGPPGLSAGPE